MCYYKRTRYSCNHNRFTILLRPCHVHKEYQADPEGCAPCDVKEPHPMHTISVRTECIQCRRMVGTVKELKAALAAIRVNVEELEQARDMAKERLEKRLEETSEESDIGAEEKAGVLELARKMARERLETRLKDAREKSSHVVGCEARAVDLKEENVGEGVTEEVEGDSNEAEEESGGIGPKDPLPNVRSSW